MSNWSWIAQSVIGTSHKTRDQKLQDAHRAFVVSAGDRQIFVGLVADGAGSARLGGQGAILTCKVFARRIKALISFSQIIPDRVAIEAIVDEIRDTLFFLSNKRNLRLKDLATTFVGIITDGKYTQLIHIGDGAAVLKLRSTGEWIVPSWPNNGEYASTTFFITDEQLTELRILDIKNDISAVAIFSDGLERLALDFSNKLPFTKFLDPMIDPVLKGTDGLNAVLQSSLADFLNSGRVNSRTDDDKTLILAASNGVL